MIELNEVRIKRIYEPATDEDGARILVDRIWPRGISKEEAALTLWLKDIAPSAELRHWFDHDIERWESFKEQYAAELYSERQAIDTLLEYVSKSPVTLLFAAHDEAHNNAVALKQYLYDHVFTSLNGRPPSGS